RRRTLTESELKDILAEYVKDKEGDINISVETKTATIKTKDKGYTIEFDNLPIRKNQTQFVSDGSWDGEVNSPNLGTGMTAVAWDSNGDEFTPKTNAEWYNYEAQTGIEDGKTSKWANAITADGSMWVWIPRYEYKITYYTDSSKQTETSSVTAYGKIDINFIPVSKTTATDGYKIHPTFEDGSVSGKNNNYVNGEWDKELAGIWIAKFEASRSEYGSSFANTATNANPTTISTKYATAYPYNSSSDGNANNWTVYNSLKSAAYGYGDAVLETSTSGSGTTSWLGDYSNFPYTSGPFFVRGGGYYDGSFAQCRQLKEIRKNKNLLLFL
ncbi:MAG: hypothetical protein LBD17_01915, partial [Endomicrobium sp.]|nr:hypothetical protein [Endomicrobium sp.]